MSNKTSIAFLLQKKGFNNKPFIDTVQDREYKELSKGFYIKEICSYSEYPSSIEFSRVEKENYMALRKLTINDFIKVS